ncbi:MAG: hypothetical protein ACK55I_22510, partial [bacterium]
MGIGGRLNVGGNIVANATTVTADSTSGAIVSRGGIAAAGGAGPQLARTHRCRGGPAAHLAGHQPAHRGSRRRSA